MSTTQYVWPPNSSTSSNASVGTNGATAPTSSTQIAGENGGLLVPIAVTSGGNIIIDGSGTPIPVSGTVAATQSGTWNITNVSGTVSLPTGASTSALQTTANTSLASIVTNTTGVATAANQTTANSSLATIATNTTNSGTPVVSGTVTANQGGTWNITNVSGTVSLPTGAATAALQTTGNTSLTTINTTLGSPFQAGGSIANTTFASTQSGTWDLRNISGTVSLPTGASTAANQATEITSLASIVTNTTGVATAANQTTANTSLSTIATNTAAKSALGTFTDRSGTATGVSAQVAASNGSRKYFIIQNLDASNPLYINFTSAATAGSGSLKILAGGSFVMESTFISTEAITAITGGGSIVYSAKEG